MKAEVQHFPEEALELIGKTIKWQRDGKMD